MKLTLALTLGVGLVGCSPGLDWREIRPEGSGVVASFPCRPDRHARTIAFAGVATRAEMLVCSTGGATFAVMYMDMTDPASITPALSALRSTAVTNIGGEMTASAPARVAGMTPNTEALRATMVGRLPDGTAVHEQAVFFVKGLRIYQASVIGARLAPEMTETYFAGLKLPS